MFIESATQLYLGRQMKCAHIVADKICTWRFYSVLDKDDDYAWQFVAKSSEPATITLSIGDQEATFNLTTDFTLYKKVFEGVHISDHPYVDVTFPVGNFFIGRTQLEHGSIVTDWQRSQDDDKSSITKLWSALEITAEEIRSEVHAAYHVVNLVPHPYNRQHVSGDEWSPSNATLGLKWTTNADGSVTATALNQGVATTAQSAYAVSGYSVTAEIGPIELDPAKQYTITGCPAGGSASTYYVRVRLFAENEVPSSAATFEDDSNQFYDYGNGLTLEAGWAYATIHLVMAAGMVIPEDGITFWPMVVEGTEQYPYAPAEDGDVSMWSMIKQNAGKISMVVDSDNNIRAGQIALAINSAGSSASIDADHIGVSGDVINLTGKNISISSTNFSVTADGTINAANANITGGMINIETSSETVDKIIFRSDKAVARIQPNGFIVENTSLASLPYKRTQVYGGAIMMYGDGTSANKDAVVTQISQSGFTKLTTSGVARTFLTDGVLTLYDTNGSIRTRLNTESLLVYDSSNALRASVNAGNVQLKNSSGTLQVGMYSSGVIQLFNTSAKKQTEVNLGYIYLYDASGTRRVSLSEAGLVFYDSNGNQTRLYAPT